MARITKQMTCFSVLGMNLDLGYCQMYKFMCSADHTCDDWVKGGPIKSMAEGSERDIL